MVGKQCRPRSDAAEAASDLGLHCLLIPVCANTKSKYVICNTIFDRKRSLMRRSKTQIRLSSPNEALACYYGIFHKYKGFIMEIGILLI